MVVKRVLVAERIRSIPPQFSWVDQRLVREGYFKSCDTRALALYLFLITVADAQGLSYYADRTLQGWLSFDAQALLDARGTLIQAGLIAHRAPIYQVLSLDAPTPPRQSGMQPLSALLQDFQALRRHGSDYRAAA
jgi:hypothetical protein